MNFKFLTGLVLSIIVSKVNANMTINISKEINPNINSINNSIGNVINNSKYLVVGEYGYTKECDEKVKSKYTDCITMLNASGMDDINNADKSQICFIFDDAVCGGVIDGVVEECKSSTTITSMIESAQLIYYSLCSKDEDGMYCPFNELLDNISTISSQEAAENICYSEKCATSLKKLINIPTFINIGGNDIEEELDQINAIECIKNINLESPKSNSDSSSNSIRGISNNVLLAIVALYIITMLQVF